VEIRRPSIYGWRLGRRPADEGGCCIEAVENVRIWDFGHTDDMIARGREVGLEYLRQHGLI
jgi:hypothetical protein